MRKHLVWVLGLALAVGVAGIALAANTHQIKAKVAPQKQDDNNYGAASLNFTTSTSCQEPCGGNGAIKPANRVRIYIDDDLKVDTQGLARCKPSDIEGTTTAQARAKCASSKVGTGQATAYIGGNPDAPVAVLVTAFNGQRLGGTPVLLIHARTESLGFTTVIPAQLKSASGDFGTLIDARVDPLPLNTALASLQVKVQKSYRAGGRRHNYVSARCHDNNKTWNFKGTDTYTGNPQLTATATQKCQER